MQSDKARCDAEGGGSGGLKDVELQPVFVYRNWYVLTTPILDCLENMFLKEECWLMEMITLEVSIVETFCFS